MCMAYLDSQLIWTCFVSPLDKNIIWKHEGRCCALHVHVFVVVKKLLSIPLPRRTFLVLLCPHPLGNSSF